MRNIPVCSVCFKNKARFLAPKLCGCGRHTHIHSFCRRCLTLSNLEVFRYSSILIDKEELLLLEITPLL